MFLGIQSDVEDSHIILPYIKQISLKRKGRKKTSELPFSHWLF